MPKIFNELVWKGYINGNGAVRTGASFNALLGRADDVSYQVNLENIEAATNVTVTHFVSNDGGKYFVSHSTPINAAGVSGSDDQKVGSTSGVNGDQAYAEVSLAGTSPKAFVELWACGRTN